MIWDRFYSVIWQQSHLPSGCQANFIQPIGKLFTFDTQATEWYLCTVLFLVNKCLWFPIPITFSNWGDNPLNIQLDDHILSVCRFHFPGEKNISYQNSWDSFDIMKLLIWDFKHLKTLNKHMFWRRWIKKITFFFFFHGKVQKHGILYLWITCLVVRLFPPIFSSICKSSHRVGPKEN